MASTIAIKPFLFGPVSYFNLNMKNKVSDKGKKKYDAKALRYELPSDFQLDSSDIQRASHVGLIGLKERNIFMNQGRLLPSIKMFLKHIVSK